MTNKLKKMLLISSLILLASCDKGIPQPPEALKVVPIWSGTVFPSVVGFYGRWMKSGEKVEMDLPHAREAGLVCTDVDSYAREEMYIREMKKLAEKRCK